MGPYGSQNFKTILLPQITFESFQTFSEFSSQWSSQKYCFGFLKFWVFDFSGILFVFVNIGPYGRQNFKTLLLAQISFESFQTFSETSSQWSWQKYWFGFLKFAVLDFSGILFVFVNIGPKGSQNFKTLLPPQITYHFWIFSTFSWIFFSFVITKVLFWIFEVLSFRF